MSRNLASKAAGDVMTLLPGRLSGISRRAILAMSLIVGVATFAKFGYLGRAVGEMNWSRLSEQNLRVDKWRVCRG